MIDNEAAPAGDAPGATHEAVRQAQTSAADPIQKEAEATRIGMPISRLTAIPEVAAYASRCGAIDRSLRKLAVEEQSGKYKRTIAEITFDAEGIITAPKDYAPTLAEAEAIKSVWKRYRWPSYVPALYAGRDLPRHDERFPWSFADQNNVAVSWDKERRSILCVEERRLREDGGKDFLIWTFWDDNTWRVSEPPDKLPLYGLETLKDAITVFVHEGPKGAKVMQALISDDGPNGWRAHPWGRELRGVMPGSVAHVGWMGGAQRPEATDWKPLIDAKARVIVVADNEPAGEEAVSRISRETKMEMEALRFTDDWPLSADLADPVPQGRIDAGTQLSDLLTPATWATDRVETDGRPSYHTRREFIKDWRYTVSPPLFFHRAHPGRGFSEAEVDARVRPFSDVELTARLIRQRLSAQADGVDYLPGSKPLIERGGRRLVNLWKPSRVSERKGSAWLLGRLFCHLFPDRQERRHLVRWGATLAACPHVRMEYAVLLRSETQGLGKTTLADIAGELVGAENVSRPNEVALTEGNFNSHLAKKRLAIVDELYSGKSKKTYNRLKSPITDKTIRVNEKYQAEYEISNFIHFIFSSNDLVPIFIDASDRRFFMPTMREAKLPRSFWVRFHHWLANGGYGIAMRCAREFVEHHGSVLPGQAAPVSVAKRQMIDDSVSDEMRSVRDAAQELFERGQGEAPIAIAVSIEDFAAWHATLCKDRGWRRLTGTRLQDELRKAGLSVRKRTEGGPDERIKIGARKLPIIYNFDAESGPASVDKIKKAYTTMEELGFREAL